MADGDLLFRLASQRLRGQIRWASGLLLLSAGLGADGPAGLRLGAVAAALVLGAASWTRLHPIRLGGLTLGVIGALHLLAGSEVLSALRSGQPAPARLPLAVVVSGLAAAAVASAQLDRDRNERKVRRLLWIATFAAVLHYLWPWPSVGPLSGLAWLVHPQRTRAASWNLLSESVLITLALSPSILVALAWLHARRRPAREASLGALLALYGAPVLLLPVVSRSLGGRRGDFATLGSLVGEVVAALAVLVAVGSSAAFVARWGSTERTAAWSKRRAVLVFSVALVLTLAPWAFGRARLEPWRLGPPTPAADRLFGELGAWNDALAARELRLEPSPERDPVAVATELVLDARQASPALAGPLEELVRAGARKDTSPEKWSRRVAEVNAASRSAGLPYYVDPAEIVVHGSARWFRLDAFRLESAERFDAGGREVELFSVRALRPARSKVTLLGLSRDGEPRALVMLDAIEAYARELEVTVERHPGRCARPTSSAPDLDAALSRCGELIREAARAGELETALRRGVARHELQHQLDRGAPPVADVLRRWARERGLAVPPQINRELSAYLAELTANEGSPHVSLARLMRIAVVDGDRIDGAAARLALEALGKGADAERAFQELAGLEPEALRQRARGAWERELGSELRQPRALD